jgi:hypothetical protein
VAIPLASRLLRATAVAFVLHWLWEATHAAACVESAGPFFYRLQHCLPMAVVDTLWTLALWALVFVPTWRVRSRRGRLTALAGLGAVTAVVVERVAVAVGDGPITRTCQSCRF